MRGTTLPAASIIYDVRALAALEMRSVNNASPSQTPAKKRKTMPAAASPPSMRTSAAASRVTKAAPSPIGTRLVERYDPDAFKAQCSRPHMEA